MRVVVSRYDKIERLKNLFADADENKLNILSDLIEEAVDCKDEITELKTEIADLKAKGARFIVVSKREKLLIQKRASYTNIMAKLCRELCAERIDNDEGEGLEDYE